MQYLKTFAFLTLIVVLALRPRPPEAGRQGQALPNDQQKLIDLLRSNAPPAEKALACKRLAIIGNGEAVPALAALLPSAELSSWARIALEVIPDAAADDALRAASGQLQGRLLVGVINSLGVRRDAKAVDGLIARLKDSDRDVAAAAAVALGHIGSEPAVAALRHALAHRAAKEVRSAVAEGCILCAEAPSGPRQWGRGGETLRRGPRGRSAADADLGSDPRRDSRPRGRRRAAAGQGASIGRQAALCPRAERRPRASRPRGDRGRGGRVGPGGAATSIAVDPGLGRSRRSERRSPDRQGRQEQSRAGADLCPACPEEGRRGGRAPPCCSMRPWKTTRPFRRPPWR